jgi:hypothetical protein
MLDYYLCYASRKNKQWSNLYGLLYKPLFFQINYKLLRDFVKTGALFARSCLKDPIYSGNEISYNNQKTPVYHPFYGASQEYGLRPG